MKSRVEELIIVNKWFNAKSLLTDEKPENKQKKKEQKKIKVNRLNRD